MMTRDSIYRLHRRQVPQNQFLRPLPRQAKSPQRPFDMRSIYHTPPRREHLDSMETYADDCENGSPQLLRLFPLLTLDSSVEEEDDDNSLLPPAKYDLVLILSGFAPWHSPTVSTTLS